MIHDWIQKSGVQKRQWNSKSLASNDKPPFSYGPSYLCDNSIRRAIMSVAPHMPRHYLVMEVKENLIAADRSKNLRRFNLPHFKKIAHIVMGEPKADYKALVHSKLLAIKQTQVNED